MPARRPAPLSDDLFGSGPGPVLLGATNNGMPLPVKNTFVDMPSGLTPASMKNKPSKGMLSAPADLNNRSPGFLRRALQASAAAKGEREEALKSPGEPTATTASLGDPSEKLLPSALDLDLVSSEHASYDDDFCTPPATPAVIASLFQSPGATPAAGSVGQLAALEAALRSPDPSEFGPSPYLASAVPAYTAQSWGPLAYPVTPGSGLAASVGEKVQLQTPDKRQQPKATLSATPIAVPAKAPAQVPTPGQEKAPAEKLLLLEEALSSRRPSQVVDATCAGAGGWPQPPYDDEDDDDESVAESEAALQPTSRAPEDVPRPPPGALHPSLGSEAHASGGCKRCCFFPRGRCMNGYECGFCHYDHDKRKRKNKKRKTKGSPTVTASVGSRADVLSSAREASPTTAAAATLLPAATGQEPVEGMRKIALAPAMLEERSAPAAGTAVAMAPNATMPGASPQTYLGYYQAPEASLSPASLLTGAYAQQQFFLYGAPGQAEAAASYQAWAGAEVAAGGREAIADQHYIALQAMAVEGYAPAAAAGPPLLSTGCSGCRACGGGPCCGACGGSGAGPLGVQVLLPPALQGGPAPPPMQPPRLQQAVSEFTPPPPMQSPKLHGEPMAALLS